MMVKYAKKKKLKELGVKAEITKKGKILVVKPLKSFWDLGGSLYNGVRLSDAELRKAREAFETEWPRRML